MRKVRLRIPPFLGKPRTGTDSARWLVKWANAGRGKGETLVANRNFRMNQKRLRGWLDGIVKTNKLGDEPPRALLDDIDEALSDYRLIVVPLVRDPWYKPVRFHKPITSPPDVPARLAIIIRSVVAEGLHIRLTKCGWRKCDNFIFTPGKTKLFRYCQPNHKKYEFRSKEKER